jgi:hypothetical protein
MSKGMMAPDEDCLQGKMNSPDQALFFFTENLCFDKKRYTAKNCGRFRILYLPASLPDSMAANLRPCQEPRFSDRISRRELNAMTEGIARGFVRKPHTMSMGSTHPALTPLWARPAEVHITRVKI